MTHDGSPCDVRCCVMLDWVVVETDNKDETLRVICGEGFDSCLVLVPMSPSLVWTLHVVLREGDMWSEPIVGG